MPAFTFEKISSPVRSTTGPGPSNAQAAATQHEPEKQPRGLIVRMLDRLVVARIKREQSDANATLPRKHLPPG